MLKQQLAALAVAFLPLRDDFPEAEGGYLEGSGERAAITLAFPMLRSTVKTRSPFSTVPVMMAEAGVIWRAASRTGLAPPGGSRPGVRCAGTKHITVR
jgi:hypothetical protein